MADKSKSTPLDSFMQQYLRGLAQHQRDEDALDQIAAERAADPTRASEATPLPRSNSDAYAESEAAWGDYKLTRGGRDLGEHLQDTGAGLMGTLGAIGNTAVLGVAAAGDALGNLTNTAEGWEATQSALEQMGNTRDYWRSLESQKSESFDRLSQYRQDRAVDQANSEAFTETGELATPIQRMMAEFGEAAGSYLENPGQILTDSIAQTPYLLTAGVAKGITSGTQLATPLIARLAQRMSPEAATKLVQMGLVGGMQGTIEGADAASAAYGNVMDSQHTFGPGEEAARESAALEAAAKAFGIAAPVSALTGTLASKFELNPFGALGRTALSRSGDNLVKALQEGFQETIESGISQFAGNYAGNSVLDVGDQVFLEQGVGGAAGTGFVVGAGSTAVTNPRAAVDAALAPMALAGKAFGYMGRRAVQNEQDEGLVAASTTADEILQGATTPAAAAALKASTPEVTTDTPAEMVELPPEISTKSPVHLFATGMEYLSGKHMDSEDAVAAYHVLGAVMESATVVRNMRSGYQQDAQDASLKPEEREHAQRELGKLDGVINEDKLNLWVDEMPMDKIDENLELLKQNPESFGSVMAQIAAINPMKVSSKAVEAALESKSLSPNQRQSLELAQDLKQAEDELRVGTAPNSSEVSRSIMQTGFPKAGSQLKSVADMIRGVTSSLEQNEPDIAQSHFNKLVSFSNYLTNRSGRFDAALKAMNADPTQKNIEVPKTRTWDRASHKLTDQPFRLVAGNENSLAVVPAVRKDAAMVAKMVAAISKRTGMKVGGTEAAAQQDPVEAPETVQEAAAVVEAPVAPAKRETAAVGLSAAPATSQEETELAALSDESLDQEIGTLTASIRRRRNSATVKAVEQDIRYNNLVREQARRIQTVVDKPVKKVAASQPEPVAALVDIVIEDDVVSTPVEATPVVSQELAVVEPSKNQYTDLMPSYPVAEGATVVEQNDAKNHLSQSFSTSDQLGLLSKLPETVGALLGDLGLTGKDAEDASKVFSYKDQLVARLQDQLGKKFPKTRRMAMLKGQNFWKEPNAHSLYAAVWDEAGIAYDSVIADVMAWTGVQQLLDMVYPVSWSADKQSAFLATYGDAILPMLQDGWVPLADQVHQVAQKLQSNLELTPDSSVSLEYTEGTMLALAMDTLGVMMDDNGALQIQQVATLAGPLVQWVKVGTDPDLLHDSARALEGFFPERASTAAGVVGIKPDKVNPLYRGSRQKVGKQQRKALLKMSQTEHKLSPLLLNLWNALPNEAGLRLFGHKPLTDKPQTLAEIAQDGANKTLMGDLRTIGAHIRAVMAHASQQEEETEVTSIPSYFEYEMVVNGRAMTKGTSPQSSKLYREMFSTVQRTIDPSQDNRGFLMAAAQGFGIKMDKQPIQTSLDQLDALLRDPKVQAALEAAGRFTSGDVSQLDADLAAFEASGIEMTPHALSAFVHMAEYQKGQPFVSSLSYEIDGLTDGPINLMMLLGLKGSATSMEHWLGLGGLWFGDSKIAVQDQLETVKDWFSGSKDLYEIIADKASVLNGEQAQRLLESVPADQRKSTQRMLQAILHVMHITKLSQSDLQALTAKHSRSFTKKPTQAAGYLQGSRSIINDLANTMLDALSERIDADQMTDGDWAAVDMLLGNKLVYSKTKKQHFLINDPVEFHGLKWEGAPLTKSQFNALVGNLFHFGGSGLADATLQTIGYQRARMFDAVSLVNAHINYAQEQLQKAYKAKQDEEVAANRLHPKQALSKQDEQALIRQVWDTIIPHPMLRNTGGLPSASTSRSGVPVQNVRRVQGALFDRQNLQVSEASFEDPGVAFAALSIMASGDGSMMTGFFANNEGNFLNMFDGIYLDPSDIDMVGEAVNKEVKGNWEHDYIGAVLDSLKLQDAGFRAWAEAQEISEGVTLLDTMEESVQNLEAQRQQQTSVMRDINSRPHSVSHMAGHNNSFLQQGTPLNSTTLGTSKTDPLLDLAADELGHVANGIRKLAKSDVLALMKGHTFENPLLSGLWQVLAPLLDDDLTVFMSSDRQALGDFYQQNERRQMDVSTDGTSIGDRVYLRAINAETMVHELLHHTTKSLTATYFSKPAVLTAQQRDAMKNLLSLQDEFLSMETASLPPQQQAMAEHVQAIMRGLDQNSALQEFLAYGLTNYHLQRTLGKTKSRLGKVLESVFQAVKKLFGFRDGTQSDSLLAQMLSNFESLTEEAAGVVYPVSVETALNAVNPDLARSFGDVLTRLEQRSATITQSIRAKNLARTRMQELADTGLFVMTNEQQSAAEYVQAIFSAGLQFKADVNAVLQRVVDAVQQGGEAAWRTNDDPHDQTDINLAKDRFAFFFENTASKHDRAADILSLALVNPEFAERMNAIVLPRQGIDKGSLDNWLDSSAKSLFDWLDTGLSIGKDATLSDALEVTALRLRKSMLGSVKRQQSKPGAYQRATQKLSEGVQWIGEKAGETAEARQRLSGQKDRIATVLNIVAGITNDHYADQMGKMVLSLSNEMEKATPLREVMQEMVGTVGDNFKLIQLKGIAARMVSAIRQTFREQVPVTLKSWFTDLTPEQDTLLHTVIGKMATYSLSQGMKDRMAELLTDPTNALLDTQMVLMGAGNRTKRALMIKYAKRLGDQMANRGTEALYRNTRAVAGLAVHDGGDRLSEKEMAALEDLSTLQALSHLTPVQRRMALEIFRNQTEGFWKTTALIDSFQRLDTQRAGENTASLNFQKGWIPVESDGRKKVKLFQASEVRKAEHMGWVQVGKFATEPNMVYMATTVGKTPTLSGGAIHSVDFHMNGIHFHSGMPTDPSIQTVITHPKYMGEIKSRILNGEVMPYTALYDAAGDVVGFQRLLDPAMVERHTRNVSRISDAAGIWLGRLHEERVAHGQNQVAAKLLSDTWQQAVRDKRQTEFVDIRTTKDKVLSNVWNTLPYHTKVQLEDAFADGSKNPPIWVRRDQLNDAVGYHKASVSNFFTGDNRYNKNTNNEVAALSRQFLGKNAYKYLLMAEEGWQGLISSAKDTIIVKSLVVALNNLASNQTQLFMITGNPVWNLRVQSQKHKELVSYLGYQQRVARLTAEGLATSDDGAKKRIDAEQAQLKIAMRKLSIYPLIEAGEMPTIAEGLSETEEFSMVGDFSDWAEKQMGKLPPLVGTVLTNLAVSKETSLYKGLDRLVQYGDFVAKASMYEWLTTQKGKSHDEALVEVNDEFVNYARLPGRYRTYGEDMGLLWFYNYKLRIMKMAFRRMRQNPAAFLIGSQVGGMLGIMTLQDSLPWNTNFAYSTGIDPLFTAHQTIVWNQML